MGGRPTRPQLSGGIREGGERGRGHGESRWREADWQREPPRPPRHCPKHFLCRFDLWKLKGTEQQGGGTRKPMSLKHSSHDTGAPCDRHGRESSPRGKQCRLRPGYDLPCPHTERNPCLRRKASPAPDVMCPHFRHCFASRSPTIDERTDKQRGVCTPRGVSFGLHKEKYSDIQPR